MQYAREILVHSFWYACTLCVQETELEDAIFGSAERSTVIYDRERMLHPFCHAIVFGLNSVLQVRTTADASVRHGEVQIGELLFDVRSRRPLVEKARHATRRRRARLVEAQVACSALCVGRRGLHDPDRHRADLWMEQEHHRWCLLADH